MSTPPEESMQYSDERAVHTWKTPERWYAQGTDWFRKRSLVPAEFVIEEGGIVRPPTDANSRLQNEAACLRFLKEKTSIPVPDVLAAYTDENGCFNIVTRLVSGVEMQELIPVARDIVIAQIEEYLGVMKRLTTKCMGGPTGIICRPHVVGWFCSLEEWREAVAELLDEEDQEARGDGDGDAGPNTPTPRAEDTVRTAISSTTVDGSQNWSSYRYQNDDINAHRYRNRQGYEGSFEMSVEFRSEDEEEAEQEDEDQDGRNKHEKHVFCHNDLSQSNVIVDPESLKIAAIIDWEFGGFYPEYFEVPYYRSPKPSGHQVVKLTAAELLELGLYFGRAPNDAVIN